MFTGIIQALGRVADLQQVGGDVRLLIESSDLPLANANIGDSIAVNGVCLTVTEFQGSNAFWMDVSCETINCTTFNELAVESQVNLEKSLTPESALGGHLVTGHVDGMGQVLKITTEARSTRFLIEAPQVLAKYIAAKGSICIDGTSLTVNTVENNQFDINIIPHTLENTLFSTYRVGTRVNLEVDIIARYVERMTLFANESASE